ncbi:hypothetical protein ACUH89_01225 [Dermabacteraceae bacterium P13264]
MGDFWRPLGVDSEEDIERYDALYNEVTSWMRSPLWEWICAEFETTRTIAIPRIVDEYEYEEMTFFRVGLVKKMCQVLQIDAPGVWRISPDCPVSRLVLETYDAISELKNSKKDLQIVDYILAYFPGVDEGRLESILNTCKSAWTVGDRAGRRGLIRRVPEGVQVGVDKILEFLRGGSAGQNLASAWEALYGLNPDYSKAYSLAIKAVEDVAIPIVSPSNSYATLGAVISNIKSQKNWALPMGRESENFPSGQVLVGMMELLWKGQRDRHGGQPLLGRGITFEEAVVAVGISTTLVHWFDAGVVNKN